MKVLLVNKFYYLSGGAERCVQLWEQLLRDRGHEVIPFAMQDPRNWPTPYARYFVRLVRFDPDAPPLEQARAAIHSLYSLDAQRRMRRLLRDARPDVAHLHSYCYQLTGSILAPLRDAGVPVFQTAHEYKHVCPNQHLFNQRTGVVCEACRGGRWHAPILARCLKGSLAASTVAAIEQVADRLAGLSRRVIRRIIAPSDFMRQTLIRFGLDAARVVRVPYFIDLDHFDPSGPPGDYFLFVGRLVPHKGIDTLLAAARRLPHVRLVIAGDGPMRPTVEETVAEYELDNVDFLGFRDGAPLRRLIEGARAVIVPSEWYDNYPFVVLEAMAAGRAVIASDIGGIPEMVRHERTGLLFAPGDVDSLVASMDALWQDKNRARALGAAGRRAAEQENAPERHYRAMMRLFTQPDA